MNIFKKISAFTAAALLVCGLAGCTEVSDSENVSNISDESSRQMNSASGVSDKTDLNDPNDTNLSEVEAANKIAADAKKLFEEFLADAAAKGYGINSDGGEIHMVSFWVEDGVWECDSDIFDHSGTVGWCGGAEDITADTTEDKAEYAEDLLSIRFAKEFRELKNAMFSFVIADGECTGAVYSGISELDGEIDFFDPDELGGRFPESFGWSGGAQGLVMYNGKPLAVGTAPVVKMDETYKPLGKADVEAANKMAAEGKKLFEELIGGAAGLGASEPDMVVLTAENGLWSCLTEGGEYPEALLCTEFAKKYSLKSASFGFAVYKGKCTGAIYLDVPYSEIDDGFEIFDWGRNNGTFPASYKWSGKEAGLVVSKVTKKTYVVGTSPVVEMNDTAVFDPYKDDALSYAYRNAEAVYGSINRFLDGMEDNGLKINKLAEPYMILINVSYGRYGVDFDDELMVDGESMAKFGMELCDAIDEEYRYSDAWIKAYIVNGKCEGVVFMSSGGGYYEHPTYADFKKGSYRWDGADNIGSVNGVTMGVYPELAYSEK